MDLTEYSQASLSGWRGSAEEQKCYHPAGSDLLMLTAQSEFAMLIFANGAATQQTPFDCFKWKHLKQAISPVSGDNPHKTPHYTHTARGYETKIYTADEDALEKVAPMRGNAGTLPRHIKAAWVLEFIPCIISLDRRTNEG